MVGHTEIAVVGGSIGGLTAACLLRDLGHDVTVYERSPVELEQRGAGIGLLADTSRYLVEGAHLPLEAISVETGLIRYLHRDGSVAHESSHRYRFSSWNTVYRCLLSHWGTARYLLGREMVGFDQSADRVTVGFAGGDEVDCGLLVCADGVGSTARQILQPGQRPGYAGYVAWRGVVPETDLPAALVARLSEAITYYVYANSHILVYPIPGADGSVLPGERLVNFVWYRNYLEGDDLDGLLTDASGVQRELSLPPGAVGSEQADELRAHALARLPEDLAAVVTATRQPFLQVIFDIEIDRMVEGRVCLLGDSASVARPHAAAGSAKAAADGWALAQALVEVDDVTGALQRYESTQLVLGRSLVARTRDIGRRSQFDNTWKPGDPDLIFGLRSPGD